MMVRVLFYASIREITKEKETTLAFSGTITELVRQLEQKYGHSLTGTDQNAADPFEHLIVMINGRHIAHLKGVHSPVHDGDVVAIFPIIGGG